MAHITGWSERSFRAEKLEYLFHILTKGADSFTTDKRMFIAHIHKRNVDKNCFGVLQLPCIKNGTLHDLSKNHIHIAANVLKLKNLNKLHKII